MKLMHISDLHIGKRVKNFSMIEEQKDVLQQILHLVDEQKPDAVLIAGDIYDKSNPSDQAIEVFDDFLVALAQYPAKVFIVSGNHDSAEDIAFANRLISLSGIYLSPVYKGQVEPVTLTDEFGPVHFYMLPFVKPIHVKHAFRDEEPVIENYTDAVRMAVEHMHLNTAERNVMISHQFVTGASRTDSEVSVGGLDNVDASAYEDFDYVALGHIHRPQNIRENHIRYSGTPLKYSFSEANDTKSVTMIDLGAKGEVSVTTIPLHTIRDFIRVEGLFEDIIEKYHDKNVDDYVEVTLLDENEILDAFRQLQRIFPHIMILKVKNTRTSRTQDVSIAPETSTLSDYEIFEDLFKKMNNQPFSEIQAAYVANVLSKIGGENA